MKKYKLRYVTPTGHDGFTFIEASSREHAVEKLYGAKSDVVCTGAEEFGSAKVVE